MPAPNSNDNTNQTQGAQSAAASTQAAEPVSLDASNAPPDNEQSETQAEVSSKDSSDDLQNEIQEDVAEFQPVSNQGEDQAEDSPAQTQTANQSQTAQAADKGEASVSLQDADKQKANDNSTQKKDTPDSAENSGIVQDDAVNAVNKNAVNKDDAANKDDTTNKDGAANLNQTASAQTEEASSPATSSSELKQIEQSTDKPLELDLEGNIKTPESSSQPAAGGQQANQQTKQQTDSASTQKTEQAESNQTSGAEVQPQEPIQAASEQSQSTQDDADESTQVSADDTGSDGSGAVAAGDKTVAAGDKAVNADVDVSGLPDLLQILVKQGSLNIEQAEDINNQHLATDEPVENIIKDQQLVKERQLVEALAEYNDIPFINVNNAAISPEALELVDESVAKRYQLLPLSMDKEKKELEVAMANPLDLSASNFIKQKTGYSLKIYYAVPSELKRIISQRYAQDLSSDVTQAVEESTIVKKEEGIQTKAGKKGGMIRAAPINKIVNTILDYAMEARASDVHIEPQPNRTRVRYRIDGILQEKLVLPSSVHSAVVSRIKILSDLKIDEKRVPQDGRFDYASKNQEVDLRVSTCPSIHGEKVVMRLLKKNAEVPGLRGLGMRGLALKIVRKAIRIPNGIILITGPTGSGKTTSLYSILNIINTPKVNIITLEDPVEYQMKRINQTQVRPEIGFTFSNGLRTLLRQDPDIIMVGEIRDNETAALAVNAALTGHLVLSTLHTNSAAGAIPRLVDMEIEPFLVTSTVNVVIAQRLMRRLTDVKEKYYLDDGEIEQLGKTVDLDRVMSYLKKHNIVEKNKGKIFLSIDRNLLKKVRMDTKAVLEFMKFWRFLLQFEILFFTTLQRKSWINRLKKKECFP